MHTFTGYLLKQEVAHECVNIPLPLDTGRLQAIGQISFQNLTVLRNTYETYCMWLIKLWLLSYDQLWASYDLMNDECTGRFIIFAQWQINTISYEPPLTISFTIYHPYPSYCSPPIKLLYLLNNWTTNLMGTNYGLKPDHMHGDIAVS